MQNLGPPSQNLHFTKIPSDFIHIQVGEARLQLKDLGSGVGRFSDTQREGSPFGDDSKCQV